MDDLGAHVEGQRAALADERAAAPASEVVDRGELADRRAGAVDRGVGTVGQGVAEELALDGHIDRADLAGEAAALGLRVSADDVRGPQRLGEQACRETDRSQAGDEDGVRAVDVDQAQRLVRGAEAARHAGAVDVRQRVGQVQHVGGLGEQQVGVPAVALPAVRLPAARGAADPVALGALAGTGRTR